MANKGVQQVNTTINKFSILSFKRIQILLMAAGTTLLAACASSMGVTEGGLTPCPASPNCVSTAATNSHKIEPFKLVVPADKAIDAIAEAIQKEPRVAIVRKDQRYMHAEFTSAVFRFVDDVEFYAQDDGNLILRSASRLGYSDLGANNRRAEHLRELFRSKGIIQ